VNLTNLNQLAAFMKMALCGLSVGFVYDVCVTFLRGKKNKTAFSDILFWLVCAGLALSSLYYANQLELRLYLALGLLFGWGVYALALSRLMAYFFAPLKQLFDAVGLLFLHLAKKVKKMTQRAASLLKKADRHYNMYAKYIFGKKKDGAKKKNPL
jgi:spore cortex biosynthesis protein YabQ